jgi:hypothetical protein
MASEHPLKSRLLANAPQCPFRRILPGRKINDVAYRCEDCGEEVVIGVPRV